MESGINIERQQNTMAAYEKFRDQTDKATKSFARGNITLKQRAEKLTDAHINYTRELSTETIRSSYYFIDKYPEFFSLDTVYNHPIQEYLNMDLKIIVKNTNQNAIDALLNENNITQYELIRKDDWLFYKFSYSIKRKLVADKINENSEIERESTYIGILEPNSSYYNSINIPRFNLLIGLTQLQKVFSKVNYNLIEPFAKLDYAIYFTINNGCEVYCLRNSHRSDTRSSPLYYEDLKYVFRSSWEADITRILNFNKINWEYEKEGFLLKTEMKDADRNKDKNDSYIPDFFLSNNTILEIKGFWNYRSVDKVYLCKTQIKDYKLKIIDVDMMYTLLKKYKHKIPQLETTIGKPKKETIPVVGVQIKDRKPFVQILNIGDELLLQRDANNEYDANAIKVLNIDGKQIGYMAKAWASIYSEKMDLGMTYKAFVKSKEPKVIKITVQRINIDEEIIYDFL